MCRPERRASHRPDAALGWVIMGVAHAPSGLVAKAREQVVKPLSPDQLVRHWDPAALPFETTAELPDVTEYFGQPRAVEAVSFGLGMRREGFNLYVMGPPGIGKQSLVRHCLAAEVAARPAPADWCYVMNFADPRKPRALRLPAGRAVRLRRAMAAFVDELGTAIPAIFESDEYRARPRRSAEPPPNASRRPASAESGVRPLRRRPARRGGEIGIPGFAAGAGVPRRGRHRHGRERRSLPRHRAGWATPSGMAADPGAALRRYQVNVIVDHSATQGPPVVVPDHCGLQRTGRPDRARLAVRRTGHRLLADQGRRPAPCERRLSVARCPQGADPAIRVGGIEALPAQRRDPHRSA